MKLIKLALVLSCLFGAASVHAQAIPPLRVYDEGTILPLRYRLNFIGSPVNCVDNPGQLRLDCTFTSGSATGNYSFSSNAMDLTGAATMSLAPTTATAITLGQSTSLADGKTLTLLNTSITTAATVGLSLNNSTAATVGAQKSSPVVELGGNGWGTTGSASQTVKFGLQLLPLQATTARAALTFSENLAAGGYTELARLYHDTTSNQVIFKLADLGAAQAILSGPGSGFDFFIANNSTLGSSYLDLANNLIVASAATMKPASDDTTQLGIPANRWINVASYWHGTKMGAQLTAASTITPTSGIHHVTGATTINLIAVTNLPASENVTVTLIADSAVNWGSSASAGGIKVAPTGAVTITGHAQMFTFDQATSLWYPTP